MRLSQLLRTLSLLACGAVLAAIAGVAYGSVNQGGQVHGCYSTATPHQLQVIDPVATPSCPSGTTPLNWVQKAPSVYSSFHDAQRAVTTPSDSSFTQVGALQLPAGSYLVIAKLTVSEYRGTSNATDQRCRLTAGIDTDTDTAGITWSTNQGTATPPSTTSFSPMTLTVVHRFTSPASATVACAGAAGLTIYVQDVKISAIKVGPISNIGY